MISPLTGKAGVFLLEKFDVKEIRDKYSGEIGVSVDRFFQDLAEIGLYKCADSGYRFFYPYIIEGDDLFYQHLGLARSGYYHERWEHLEALKIIGASELWLEVGSGGGDFLRLCRTKSIVVEGLELNLKAVDYLASEGFNISGERIEAHRENEFGVYDGVALFQVLEHIHSVGNMFREFSRLIRPGGKLVIGVPNNNPYLFGFDKYHTLNLPPHHMGWWNKESLIFAGQLFGFKVEKIIIEPLSKDQVLYCLDHRAYNGILRPFKKILYRLLKSKRIWFSDFALLIARLLGVKGRNILAIFSKVAISSV